MDHYLTAGEVTLLLVVFWAPVFGIAAVVQSRLMVPSTATRIAIWLVAALILETVLAFVILISPLDRLFVSANAFPAGLEMGSVPFQAGILAAVLTTVWLLGRRFHAIDRQSARG